MTIEDELVELASHTLGASSRWRLTVERDDRGFTLVADLQDRLDAYGAMWRLQIGDRMTGGFSGAW